MYLLYLCMSMLCVYVFIHVIMYMYFILSFIYCIVVYVCIHAFIYLWHGSMYILFDLFILYFMCCCLFILHTCSVVC